MQIFVKVKPRSRKNTVVKIDADHFSVSVTKVPEKGKANEAVIEALAEHFKIAKSKINILSGLASKNKKVEITLAT